MDEIKHVDSAVKEDKEEQNPNFYQLYETYKKNAEQRVQEEHRKKQEIYAMHGITADKVEGASEYYNAMFKGIAIFTVGSTMAMILVSFLCCGLTSATSVFTILALAVEGELLSMENLKNVPMRILARIFLMVPAGMSIALVVCDLAQVPEFAMWVLLIVFEGISIALAGFGGIMYFIYNPYHAQRKQMRAAKAEIKLMMKERKKEEKREQKKSTAQKKKEQKRLQKLEKKEQIQSEKRQLKIFIQRQREKAEELSRKVTHPETKGAESSNNKKNEMNKGA